LGFVDEYERNTNVTFKARESQTMQPYLKHETVKIRQLVADYRAGHIVIPEFQREYIWKKSKAPRLLDSLYRGWPISSLLLWDTTEQVTARRNNPRPTRAGSLSWLIDGQQRVITLARTMSGDEGIEVVFHQDKGEFRLANAATRNDGNWIRVADLWDDDQYRQLRKNLDGGNRADKREANFELVRRVLDYEVPLVRMCEHEFQDAVDAFTRINTLGVRLKVEDIESARIAARHSKFIIDEVLPFVDSLQRQGFTRLSVMHLFRACAFVARPDGRTRTPLHELERGEVLSAWRRTRTATERAIGLVRSDLGLVNMAILWSGALLGALRDDNRSRIETARYDCVACARGTLTPIQRLQRNCIGSGSAGLPISGPDWGSANESPPEPAITDCHSERL
jgi:Protein of unknown function DUF262